MQVAPDQCHHGCPGFSFMDGFHNREEPNVNPRWDLTIQSLRSKNAGGRENRGAENAFIYLFLKRLHLGPKQCPAGTGL